MVMRVTQYGEPILRHPAKPVTVFDEALRDLARDMIETMVAAEGIGLAAQQVGIDQLICVVDPGETDPPYRCRIDGREQPMELILPLVLINPVMTESGEKISFEEGCLSIPEVRGNVSRPDTVHLRYQDLDGDPHELEANGLLARVIQHEVDHLQGVLFVDHLLDREKRSVSGKLRRLERESRKLAASG